MTNNPLIAKYEEFYGKKHYDNEGWECNIIEKFLANSLQHPLTTLTPKQTIPCAVSDVP